MNTLYIHGLNGSLTPEKRVILERYGNVQSPAIDYENNPDSIMWIYNQYKDAKIDIIMGSSMGGFAGYHLSKLFKTPALLFNPALSERSVFQNIPETGETNGSCISIVLGSKDTVVSPKDTLSFLGDILMQSQNYNISIRYDLEHRIPVHVFEEEVTKFFENVSPNILKPRRLFLDDLRSIVMVYDKTFESEFDIVRTYDDFVDYIMKNGLPEFISFDNDLGLDDNGKLAPDGLAAAKWLVYESGLDLRTLQYKVHSANPVAAEQIRGLLGNYMKHLNNLNS
ncbi:YqiA/YcfP family alpha/beta fold hydrolase [Gelidibacter sp.]|uniref:YqiA/YcfP family alpha/beta fold hydrolase n=1 Tax=Gelidibacter sp. TaxID=2018083 RepID=UPI003264BEB7